MERQGVPMTPAVLEAVRERDKQDRASLENRLPIWPEHGPPAIVFFAMATQWRTGLGGYEGLDYQAIEPTARMLGLTFEPQAFQDIRIMEDEALRVIRSRRK